MTEIDRIIRAIGVIQHMLSKLAAGLATGESLIELKKLSTEIAIAATAIETLIDNRLPESKSRP